MMPTPAIKRWLTCVLLGLVLAAATPDPAVIRSLRLEESATGATIELATAARLRWTAGYSEEGALVIRLDNSRPARRMQRDYQGEDLISSVTVATDESAAAPQTLLFIQTRADASYSVKTSEINLVVIMLKRPASVPAAEGGGSAPIADAPSTAPQFLTIGPGDLLEIDVFGLDELSRKVRVLGDGTITLPLLGNFSLAGSTIRDAEHTIARMLAEQRLVNNPQVSVFVAESVSGGVSVQGAVANPGVYQLFGRSTLLEMLGRAGGLTKEPGGQILVLRGGEGEQQERFQIDVTRLIDEGDIELNIALHPGDLVIVPVARRLRVYVTGAVQRPGAVEYSSSEGITVLQAITAAGGPTQRANLKKVTIRRHLADGTEDSLRVNVKAIQKGKAEDVSLERNDTVVVGEWLL